MQATRHFQKPSSFGRSNLISKEYWHYLTLGQILWWGGKPVWEMIHLIRNRTCFSDAKASSANPLCRFAKPGGVGRPFGDLSTIWGFPKMGVSPNGWYIRENPLKLGWFRGTPISGNPHIYLETLKIEGWWYPKEDTRDHCVAFRRKAFHVFIILHPFLRVSSDGGCVTSNESGIELGAKRKNEQQHVSISLSSKVNKSGNTIRHDIHDIWPEHHFWMCKFHHLARS